MKKKNIIENILEYKIKIFYKSFVYDKNTSDSDIRNDILVKRIITNNLRENEK